MGRVKRAERLTIQAVLERSAKTAIEALSQHPLVPSEDCARRIFDGYRAAQPLLAARFNSPSDG
jgi:alpha-galactosidase/6-phospho-beta-glucosidase family protein